MWDASFVLLHGTKWAILLNLYTMTNTLSHPYLVLDSPMTKSIDMDSQGLEGFGKGW